MPYLFAILSIILLLPFVIFLNLGISKKGKLLIVLISLLIAVLGLLAQISYPLWQLALIMLSLILLSTYLLNRRFEKLIYSKYGRIEPIMLVEEVEEETFSEEFDEPIEEAIQFQSTEEVAASLQDPIPSENIDEENSLFEEYQFDNFDAEIPNLINQHLDLDIDVEEISIIESTAEDELEEIHPIQFSVKSEKEIIVELDEDIIPIKPVIHSEKDMESKNKLKKVHYLSEIEKLLEED